MKKYTFTISKPGFEATDPSPKNLLIDADYPFFKFHQDSEGTVTLTPGDTHASVDFNHGLSYTPAFIAYYKDQNNKLHFVPGLPYPFGFVGSGIDTAHAYAYVDGTKVRCGVQINIGAYNYYDANATGWYSEHAGGTNDYLLLGNQFGGQQHGALRFESLSIPQGATIVEAILKVAVEYKGSGTGNLEAKIYGIDEDNTAAFGNPSGRPRTTAFDDASWSLPAAGGYSNHDVTAIVQEIVNRAGWASDNAMGFYLLDDSSPTDVMVEDVAGTGIQSQLTVKYGSNQTLNFRTIIFKDKIA